MTPSNPLTWSWHFGGALQSLPPRLAWACVVFAALAGTALVLWSYFHTLRPLRLPQRLALLALRVLLLSAFLLCLANPTRVETSRLDASASRPLAVLIDRSASMETPDNRSETRLQNASRIWEKLAPAAEAAHGASRTYRFRENLEPADNLKQALSGLEPSQETPLFASLKGLLHSGPPSSGNSGFGAIVCLTDGLDTTSESPGLLTQLALQQGTPLYFVPGQNRSRMQDSLVIREFKTPSQVLRQSSFRVEALVEVAGNGGANVSATLLAGTETLDQRSITLKPGTHLLPLRFTVPASEPASLDLELRVSQGEQTDKAGSRVEIVNKRPIRVLFYQGALQWGYGFFAAALRGDPSFQMDAIFNPALNVKTLVSGSASSLKDLPESSQDLKPYDILVLAHLYSDQVSEKQQQAILDYCKQGGGVLFVTPGSGSSEMFSGSLLEQMLPVIFQAPPSAPLPNPRVADFQRQMKSIGGASTPSENLFANFAVSLKEASPLYPFTPSPDVKASPLSALFAPKTGDSSQSPQFSDYTPLKNVKSGAEIIAVHPSETNPDDGKPRILLARQPFGAGQAATLATDLLWRWKLSLPSESRQSETFWQQLLLAMAIPSPNGLHFMKNQQSYSLGRPVSLRLEGGGASSAPRVNAVSAAGLTVSATVKASATSGWDISFTPEEGGIWQVEATTPSGLWAKALVHVGEAARSRELSGEPADLAGLRKLAESTGGTLLDLDSSLAPQTYFRPPLVLQKEQPLWNQSWIFLLCLSLYITELIWRRSQKLL